MWCSQVSRRLAQRPPSALGYCTRRKSRSPVPVISIRRRTCSGVCTSRRRRNGGVCELCAGKAGQVRKYLTILETLRSRSNDFSTGLVLMHTSTSCHSCTFTTFMEAVYLRLLFCPVRLATQLCSFLIHDRLDMHQNCLVLQSCQPDCVCVSVRLRQGRRARV